MVQMAEEQDIIKKPGLLKQKQGHVVPTTTTTPWHLNKDKYPEFQLQLIPLFSNLRKIFFKEKYQFIVKIENIRADKPIYTLSTICKNKNDEIGLGNYKQADQGL